jgi:hypothetical protein
MTNKIALKTTEDFMAGYVPTYTPIYTLFLGNSQAFSQDVGTATFKRIDTVGDIRSKHILPKDTEIREIAVAEKSKVFKKYFLGNRYVHSHLQDPRGSEDVVKQVLDEAQKVQDDLLLLGEGTSASTMINNGLFWSADPNYVLQGSEGVTASSDNHLNDFHEEIVETCALADAIAGRKLLMIYGTSACSKFDALYVATNLVFKEQLAKVLGPNYTIVKMPADVTPSNTNGWIVANLDQIKLNYTVLPTLWKQGENEENMYSWHNFMQGSMMLEVNAYKGIIRQPCTFA